MARDEDNGLNAKEIKEILAVLKDSDVTELELERGAGVRLKIRRGPPPAAGAPMMAAPMMMHAPQPQIAAAAAKGGDSGAAPAAAEKPGKLITSPFVGTFYRAPSPDAPNYVDVGAAVKKGQVLCIVEAMKLMNEIEAEFDGKVAEILAENSQPVEYGQALFRIEPA
jgi:acetyl-CoA carboxylase biotin carboxyl carrier protein